MTQDDDFDLQAIGSLDIEELAEDTSLGTWGTTSSVGTGSCPASTAGTASSASSAG
ncbi:thiocillin family RiPP [Cryptosporangium minutisporangium]|uniref:Thiocillin family RiPP n=1 Tax=Cryptosporangium minutisporangium TaxID=113569 RepID=A0ABP6SZZ6_9ACTN